MHATLREFQGYVDKPCDSNYNGIKYANPEYHAYAGVCEVKVFISRRGPKVEHMSADDITE